MTCSANDCYLGSQERSLHCIRTALPLPPPPPPPPTHPLLIQDRCISLLQGRCIFLLYSLEGIKDVLLIVLVHVPFTSSSLLVTLSKYTVSLLPFLPSSAEYLLATSGPITRPQVACSSQHQSRDASHEACGNQ